MNGAIVLFGFLAFITGIGLAIYGSRSRGEMEIELGKFKGPVWFLIIIFGIFVMTLGALM